MLSLMARPVATAPTTSTGVTVYSDALDTLGLQLDSFDVLVVAAVDASSSISVQVQEADAADFSDAAAVAGALISMAASGQAIGTVKARPKRRFRCEVTVVGTVKWTVLLIPGKGCLVPAIANTVAFDV